jgi:hypothetical protein
MCGVRLCKLRNNFFPKADQSSFRMLLAKAVCACVHICVCVCVHVHVCIKPSFLIKLVLQRTLNFFLNFA